MASRFLAPNCLAEDAAVSGGLEMRGVAGNEDADFEARVKVMKEFMGSERFKHTTRPYKARNGTGEVDGVMWARPALLGKCSATGRGRGEAPGHLPHVLQRSQGL